MHRKKPRVGQERAPVLFRCLLDEQPADLLPNRALAELKRLRVTNGLILNPRCQFFSGDLCRLPFLERFYSMPETVWCLDPATDALLPFGLSGKFRGFLGCALPGEPAPRDMPAQVAAVLRFAGLLVDSDYKSQRQCEWGRIRAELGAVFQKHGYVSLKGLLHPFHLASLRRYYRELISAGEFKPDKEQGSKRVWMHNEPISRFFHCQLTSVVSDLAGEAVEPSYAFVWCCRGGAELRKHIDREQCEFTISLCVDFIPEPRTITRWPLYIETKQGPAAVRQVLGEALLFRGRELPHYRDPLPHGCTSTSVLFHFVPRGFSGQLD